VSAIWESLSLDEDDDDLEGDEKILVERLTEVGMNLDEDAPFS